MPKISFETIKSKDVVAGVAMVCITAIEFYAISQGINGAVLGVVIAFLAGLGGFYKGKPKPEP